MVIMLLCQFNLKHDSKLSCEGKSFKKSLMSVSSYILLIHSKIAAGFCAHTVTSVAVGYLVGNVV